MIHALETLAKPIDFKQIFKTSQDVHLEIGVGKGRYLNEIVHDRPDLNFVGLEKSVKWFKKAEHKVHQKVDLSDRVFLIHGYAEDMFSEHLPEKCFHGIHIMFPDPWPKRKHLGRRIFSEDNIRSFEKHLIDQGDVFFATDFLDYFDDVKKLFKKSFSDTFSFTEVEPFSYTSNFQAKYNEEGRPMGFAHIKKLR